MYCSTSSTFLHSRASTPIARTAGSLCGWFPKAFLSSSLNYLSYHGPNFYLASPVSGLACSSSLSTRQGKAYPMTSLIIPVEWAPGKAILWRSCSADNVAAWLHMANAMTWGWCCNRVQCFRLPILAGTIDSGWVVNWFRCYVLKWRAPHICGFELSFFQLLARHRNSVSSDRSYFISWHAYILSYHTSELVSTSSLTSSPGRTTYSLL